MKAIAIIHDDIWQQVVEDEMWAYEGDPITTLRRDPVWETGTDEEGNPYRTFEYNDEPYEVEEPEIKGGYSLIGEIGPWNVVLIASKGANLQAINQLDANKVLGLALIQTDEDGNISGWDAKLNDSDRQVINTKLEAAGKEPIPENATARQAVRHVWRFIDSRFDEYSFDVADG